MRSLMKIALAVLCGAWSRLAAGEPPLAELCADRAAIERVYHEHRTGEKPPFEKALPAAMIEQLVRRDLHEQRVLREVYGVVIAPEAVRAEVARIEATTRAPEMLAEIKAALGHDAARFARGLALPGLVDRELRRRFENDDRLHAKARAEADIARTRLMAREPVSGLRAVTWSLRPAVADRAPPVATSPPPVTKANAASAAYHVQATAQVAQVLAAPGQSAADEDGAPSIHSLDPALRAVLLAQLTRPGDVSAVIESATGFLVFVAGERTADTLKASVISVAKVSYDEWLQNVLKP